MFVCVHPATCSSPRAAEFGNAININLRDRRVDKCAGDETSGRREPSRGGGDRGP